MIQMSSGPFVGSMLSTIIHKQTNENPNLILQRFGYFRIQYEFTRTVYMPLHIFSQEHVNICIYVDTRLYTHEKSDNVSYVCEPENLFMSLRALKHKFTYIFSFYQHN